MRICEFNNCHFPVFGTDKKTKIGYCKMHQSKRTDLKKKTIPIESTKRLETKVRTFVRQSDSSTCTEEIRTLEKWFEQTMKAVEKNPYCWNCGKFIPRSFYKAACAHIVPKRKTYGFPSVSTHDMNFVVLGAGCGCHAKYDNSWDDAQSMKIWPIAVERFKTFCLEIDKKELKNLPPVLEEIIQNALK